MKGRRTIHIASQKENGVMPMCGGGVCFGHVSLKRPALYDFLRRTTTPHSSLLTRASASLSHATKGQHASRATPEPIPIFHK